MTDGGDEADGRDSPDGGPDHPSDQEFLDASGIDRTSLDPPPDQLASLAQRAVARSVDLLVVAVLSLAVLTPQLRVQAADDSVPRWAKIAVAAIWVGYEGITTALLGQTMGKLAGTCRVADRRTGRSPGLARSIVRAAVVPGLLPIIGALALLAYPTALLDRRERRGLLDRLAGTVVVKSVR